MRLVKLPSATYEGKFIYINPDNVTCLYDIKDNDLTYVVTNDTGADECGYKVLLPIDEVAARLENGNNIYDVMKALKVNKDGDSDA